MALMNAQTITHLIGAFNVVQTTFLSHTNDLIISSDVPFFGSQTPPLTLYYAQQV